MAVTSTTATTAIDVCNRALVLIGASPMTSFEDGTNEALVAVNLYEDTCRATLVNTRWRFATDQRALNRLTSEPTGRWDAAYLIPAESLFVHAVTVNDAPIQYDIFGNMVYCDATTNDTGIARDDALSSMMFNNARFYMQRARTMDSQQQTTRKLITNRFIVSRRS